MLLRTDNPTFPSTELYYTTDLLILPLLNPQKWGHLGEGMASGEEGGQSSRDFCMWYTGMFSQGSHASPMAAPLLRPHYSYQLPSEYCVTFIRRWVPYSMVLQHTCPGVQNSPLHVFPSNWSVNPTGQLQWTPVDVSLHVRSQPPLLTAHVSSQQ